MSEALLRASCLTHVYSAGTPFEKAAVADVSFEIGDNEFIGVIGHTGSGKSTLIQSLNGLLKPSSGQIFYQGQDIWKKGFSQRELRFRVGLVFQYPEYQLFEETVEKDIAFGPKNMGLSEEEIRQRVEEAMYFVGLPDRFRTRSPFELSGGQKRRAAIAGIMAMRPRVLILDEPTAGLDPRGCHEILSRIREYQQTEKITVILVSHSMEDICANAQKVMVLHQAHLVMFAPTEEVFARAGELSEMGLSVPQITRVFLTLSQKGYDLSSVFSVARAADEILRKAGRPQ